MGYAFIVLIIFVLIIISFNSNSKKSEHKNNHAAPKTVTNLDKQTKEQKNSEVHNRQKEEIAKQNTQFQNLELERLQQEKVIKQIEIPIRLEQRDERITANENALKILFKANFTNFQIALQQHNITKLYHFTDKANLPSIKQYGGLYSWDYCSRNNITIPKPGGSPTSWILDKGKGLQNFVRVSFVKDHPMLFVARNDGRIENPVVLEIKLDVIYLKNTKYANQNAAKNGVIADGSFEQFNSINFPILRRRYFDLSTDEKPYYQAEVLILEKIPIEYITNINIV